MVKSFGSLKMLYHLKTWTDAQEIAWKILWSVVALEIVFFFKLFSRGFSLLGLCIRHNSLALVANSTLAQSFRSKQETC